MMQISDEANSPKNRPAMAASGDKSFLPVIRDRKNTIPTRLSCSPSWAAAGMTVRLFPRKYPMIQP